MHRFTLAALLLATSTVAADKVDPHAPASGVAVIAVTAYAISTERVPRFDRRAQLEPTGDDLLLRADARVEIVS